jgi:hypothetical protein
MAMRLKTDLLDELADRRARHSAARQRKLEREQERYDRPLLWHIFDRVCGVIKKLFGR